MSRTWGAAGSLALPEPDPAELTPDNVNALISDTITEIRDRIVHRAPGPLAETSTKAI